MSLWKKIKIQGYNLTNWQNIQIDSNTRAINTITEEHHQVHVGKSFKVDVNTDDIQSAGSNNALHISFLTQTGTALLHIILDATATGVADLSMNEGGSLVSGSSLTIFNKNRGSTIIIRINP